MGDVQGKRAQSAMEYLMTYGWAILIIAVILGALYQVGVFNPYTFSPKVAAGACKVARGIVDGQVTSSKVGTCNNALPQYAASFQGSGVATLAASIPAIATPSVTAWVYTKGTTVRNDVIDWNDVYLNLQYISSTIQLCTAITGGTYSCQGALTTDTWTFVAMTWTGTSLSLYINGAQVGSPQAFNGVASNSGESQIGACNCGVAYNNYWNGYLANIQFYNASLTGNEISALYKEGIGGDPVNTKNLVGWWPLNGDAKDYSGNGYDASAANVIFTGSWMAGYAAP